jgi:hypothetical protein
MASVVVKCWYGIYNGTSWIIKMLLHVAN